VPWGPAVSWVAMVDCGCWCLWTVDLSKGITWVGGYGVVMGERWFVGSVC